jgi:hypothetical protein
MPFPIVPAPSTATVLMESMDKLHPFESELEDALHADRGQAERRERTCCYEPYFGGMPSVISRTISRARATSDGRT